MNMGENTVQGEVDDSANVDSSESTNSGASVAPQSGSAVVCEQFPDLKRMIYCYGQMLGAQDFIDEQTYFLDKIALLNRCLHGYGVVCGLQVSRCDHPPEQTEAQTTADQPAAEQDSDQGDKNKRRHPIIFQVACGLGVSREGRELVLREPKQFNFWKCFDKYDWNWHETEDEFEFYVTLCYAKQKTNRRRLELTAECKDGPEYRHIYTRLRERPCIRLTKNPPPKQSCDPCCQPIDECCLWLARVTIYRGQTFRVEIDNTIRRPLGLYQPTTITGINWLHGATYSENLAGCLLKNGLEISFSGLISKESVQSNAIVDVMGIDGHGIGFGQIHMFPTEIPYLERVEKDNKPPHHKLVVRVPEFELNNKDRVHVTLRGDFILDECCCAIDGNHIGGLVPFSHWDPPGQQFDRELEYIRRKNPRQIPRECNQQVGVTRPAMSGNGNPGGSFESWIYVQSNEKCQKQLQAEAKS